MDHQAGGVSTWALLLGAAALTAAVLGRDLGRALDAIRNARRWQRLDPELRQRKGLR